MRFDPSRLVAVLLLTILASGCATAPEVPPILSLDGRACAPQFDLVGARALPSQDSVAAAITVDDKTPCWQSTDGQKSVYLAFRLPTAPGPYLASVTSTPQGKNLIPPRILVVDFYGNVLRQQPRENFFTHGAALSASIRLYPGDFALIVASDPASIGVQSSQILSATQVSTQSAGLITYQVHTGSEKSLNFVSTYNGIISVALKPMPQD